MKVRDDGAGGTRAGTGFDDMCAQERLREAFGLLRAPTVTYERTCAMVQSDGKKARGGWTRRVTVRSAVVGAAAAMLLASGAYAAASSDFFASAFGDKGQDDVAAHEVVDAEKKVEGVEPVPWTAPAMEWVATDPAEAERIVGEALATVGQAVTLNGTTLTVESCVVDANGLGVATFVLENPEGVAIGDAGYGEFYLDPEGPVLDAFARGADDAPYDHRLVLDKTLSTETEVHGVLYFGPFGTPGDGEGSPAALEFGLNGLTAPEEYGDAVVEFAPAQAMGTVEFAADGVTASLSPIGMVFAGEPVGDLWASSVTVRFADGSEYVVQADDVANTIVSWFMDDHAEAEVFNRLADPAAVTSVAVVLGETGETVELLPTV